MSIGVGITTRQEQVATSVRPPASGTKLLIEDTTGYYLSEASDILVTE